MPAMSCNLQHRHKCGTLSYRLGSRGLQTVIGSSACTCQMPKRLFPALAHTGTHTHRDKEAQTHTHTHKRACPPSSKLVQETLSLRTFASGYPASRRVALVSPAGSPSLYLAVGFSDSQEIRPKHSINTGEYAEHRSWQAGV